MKKVLLFLLVLFLTACSDETYVTTLAEPTPDQELLPNDAGCSLSISKDVYTDPAPFFEITLKNESPISYEYGEYYRIDVYKEDKWYIMTHSDAVFLENPRFTNLGLLLPPGREVHQTFFVKLLGVTLVPGEYRLVKIFQTPKEPFYVVTLAVPFTVEDTVLIGI